MSDAWVVLAPSDPRAGAIQTAQSDQGGQFSFSGMPPGDYRILAVSELSNGEAENPDFLRSHSTDGERFTLDARERRSIAVSVGK